MRVVLFDLDGTLLDSGPLYAECYLEAFTDVLDEPPTFEEMLARRPSSERLFLLEWYGEEVGDRIHRRMVEAYEAKAAHRLAGLFEGVEELLDALRGHEVRTGIVSGKSRRAYEATTRHVPLDGFDVVVLEDDVPAPKPDPGGIERALAQLGARPEETVYVGDTPWDAEAARRAGVAAASALWCRAEEERPRVASSLDEGVWPLHAPGDLLGRIR
ncbi:MAG TPA: HAD-IA family hydrolase [Sandaracinaceae bacterium LLY-WYZ-13_1]|nr:HAD-IA family hydrolase [Sandaracinaceae bacterium LLY-WYZ-13_1]